MVEVCFSETGGWVADMASPNFFIGVASTVAYERIAMEGRREDREEGRSREVEVRRAVILTEGLMRKTKVLGCGMAFNRKIGRLQSKSRRETLEWLTMETVK